MAKRKELERLYRELADSQFAFLGRGEHDLTDIYLAVERRFPSLCDNNYLCTDNCKRGNPDQPEWKHTIRNALNNLKTRGLVAPGTHPRAWIIKARSHLGRGDLDSRKSGDASHERKDSRKRLRGAGFGSPVDNKRVEQAAIRHVERHYMQRGWRVLNVGDENRGYDLMCSMGRSKRHVEVKGASGESAQFIITANEAKVWISDPNYVLALVKNALSKTPSLVEFVGPAGRRAFQLQPIAYWAVQRGLRTRLKRRT